MSKLLLFAQNSLEFILGVCMLQMSAGFPEEEQDIRISSSLPS
jgi:hypothetical protein